LYWILIKNEKLQLYGLIDYFLLGYLLINIISWFVVPIPYKYPAMPTVYALCTYVLLCVFVSRYLSAEKHQYALILLWVVASIGISIYALIQYLIHKRVVGTLGNENFLGSHIAITILVSFGFFMEYFRKGRKYIYIFIPIAFLFLTTLYLSHSRGGYLSVIFGFLFFTITAYIPKNKRLLVWVIISVFIMAGILTPYGINFVSKQFEGDVRPPIWEGILSMITQKPWLGWGKGALFIFYPIFRVQEYWMARTPTDLTIHAHNEFLQIWAETGIIGLLFFMTFVYFVIRTGIKAFDERNNPKKYIMLGVLSAIIGLLIHNLVCNNLQMPSSAIFMWILFGMVISYAPKKEYSFAAGLYRGKRCLIFVALIVFINIIIWQDIARPAVAQYYFKKGTKYRETKEWQNAISEYKKAIDYYPWDIEIHYRLAYAYTQINDFNNAINSYRNVEKLAPMYGNVHRNMSVVYLQMGNYKDSATSCIQSLRINENDFIAYTNLSKMRSMSRKNKTSLTK
jgi:O-antigen ligase